MILLFKTKTVNQYYIVLLIKRNSIILHDKQLSKRNIIMNKSLQDVIHLAAFTILHSLIVYTSFQ